MKAVRLVEVGQPLQMREVPLPAVGEKDDEPYRPCPNLSVPEEVNR